MGRAALTGSDVTMTIQPMRRSLRWIALALALVLAVPVPAWAQPPAPPALDAGRLALFGRALTLVQQHALDPVSAGTLLARALHGLGTVPAFGAQQRRLVAEAAGRLAAVANEDFYRQLTVFVRLLEALHATSGSPGLDDMLRAALAGMLDGLDARSRFAPPAPLVATTGGAGAGLKLKAEPDGPLVVQAFAHAPAADAGVRQGDHLVAVDDHPVRDLPLEEVVFLLRGPVGSLVTLLVRRPGSSDPVTIHVTRAVVRLPLVSARLVGRTAVLQPEEFTQDTAQALHRALTDLQGRSTPSISGIVLDLRDSPGGLLTATVATAGEFLPPTTLVATTAGRVPADDQRFTATAGDVAAGLPMVVLVNEGTGSGSEIIADALRVGRGAVVMGGHTAGAGLVVTVIPLQPLGTMTLATQRIILASGRPLQPPGVLPQVALVPWQADPQAIPPLETPDPDPMVTRLRRGIPRTTHSGEAFNASDAVEPDFEVRQACAALAMLQSHVATRP